MHMQTYVHTESHTDKNKKVQKSSFFLIITQTSVT